MRITKDILRTAKKSFRKRLNELSAILATGGIKEEFKEEFKVNYPGADSIPERDAECFRLLLWDAMDKAIPDVWCD